MTSNCEPKAFGFYRTRFLCIKYMHQISEPNHGRLHNSGHLDLLTDFLTLGRNLVVSESSFVTRDKVQVVERLSADNCP